ncbi:MAG: CRISPR system precrRNA processing endoribonuclease RAMP protein Cas6 [Dethiobacteria bacterium]
MKYTGKLEEYLPLIKLGELVHIGEKAVLGFGRYRFTTQGLRNPKLSSK